MTKYRLTTYQVSRRSRAAALGGALLFSLSTVTAGHAAPPSPAAVPTSPPVVVEINPSLPTHTIYRPNFGRDPVKQLPVLLWENGACGNDPTQYTLFLEHVAARGFFVIAKGFKGGDPNGWPAPGSAGTAPNDLMRNALNWAGKETIRPGSPYRGRIDAGHIGLMGWSCGGFTALHVATLDRRVASVLMFNSSVNPLLTTEQAKAFLGSFPAGLPVAWVTGGPTDIAYPLAKRDWSFVPESMPSFHIEYRFAEPASPSLFEGGHFAFWMGRQAGRFQPLIAEMALQWFSYTLLGDRKAQAYFFANPCGFCSDPAWSVQAKNWSVFQTPGRAGAPGNKTNLPAGAGHSGEGGPR